MNYTESEGREKALVEPDCAAEISAVALLSMARGFTCVFWGLLLSVVLLFSNAFFELFEVVRIPAYLLGSAIAAWGLFGMREAGLVSRVWTRRRRFAFLLILLHIYFAPFVVWWSGMPESAFFLVNFLCFILVGMLCLLSINLLAAESARCLNHRGDWVEAWLFAAGTVMFMMVPFLFWVAGPVAAVVRFKTSLYYELWSASNRTPDWVRIFICLPCSLTLVSAWKARSQCYRRFLAE